VTTLGYSLSEGEGVNINEKAELLSYL